jgi:hypothetical protein
MRRAATFTLHKLRLPAARLRVAAKLPLTTVGSWPGPDLDWRNLECRVHTRLPTLAPPVPDRLLVTTSTQARDAAQATKFPNGHGQPRPSGARPNGRPFVTAPNGHLAPSQIL